MSDNCSVQFEDHFCHSSITRASDIHFFHVLSLRTYEKGGVWSLITSKTCKRIALNNLAGPPRITLSKIKALSSEMALHGKKRPFDVNCFFSNSQEFSTEYLLL